MATNRILLCKPEYYGIYYSINPWMNPELSSGVFESHQQWESLKNKLEELKAEVYYIDPIEGLPDIVFTANAGLILDDNSFLLSNFKHTERKGESQYFKDFFLKNNFTVYETDFDFEGAGDALFLCDYLIAGYGFRSELGAYQDFNLCWKHKFKNFKFLPVRLVNPYFYHLDTCFCPLNNGDYLIYPDAFDDISAIEKIGGNKIEVNEDEAKNFACNAVVLNYNVILPENCPNTESKLQKLGYKTHSVSMTEFIKAGGACKCLTLKF